MNNRHRTCYFDHNDNWKVYNESKSYKFFSKERETISKHLIFLHNNITILSIEKNLEENKMLFISIIEKGIYIKMYIIFIIENYDNINKIIIIIKNNKNKHAYWCISIYKILMGIIKSPCLSTRHQSNDIITQRYHSIT